MGSIILNIIINVISSEIFDYKPGIIQKIRFSKFKKRLHSFINEFFEKNDGTVITTGRFAHFFENYHVTQSALDVVLDTDNKVVGEKEYVEDLLSKFKDSHIEPEDKLKLNDERILKEFFSEIYKMINYYISSSLSVDSKYIINKQRSENKKLTEEIRTGSKEVIDLIKQNEKSLNSDIAFGIFEVLKGKILTGELEFVNKILPLIEGKNNDVENGLKIIFSSFSEYNLVRNRIELLSKIKSLEISREVEKILILEFFDDYNKLDELKKKCKNEHLCQLIESIKNNKRDDFYKLEITKKDHIDYYNYTIADKFYNELWLVKRLILKFADKEKNAGTENIIETLLSDNRTFVDELMILEKRQLSSLKRSLSKSEALISEMRTIRDILNKNMKKYAHSQKHIQIKFYELLICAKVLIGEENLELMFEELPEFMNTNIKTQAYKYLHKINSKKVDADDLINFCLHSGEYWLLNNYFVKYNCSPESIIDILTGNISFVKNDFWLFLVYVESIRIHRCVEYSKKILNEYQEKYDKYLEFWIQLYCATNPLDAPNLLKTVIDKWSNDEITSYLPVTVLNFAEILIKNRSYDIADSLVTTYEAMHKPNSVSIRIRGAILLSQGKEIAARELFIKNFSYYENDPWVIEMIIVISLNRLRSIPDNIIEYAINIGTTKLLMLCSLIYHSKKEYDKAKILIMKALVNSPDSSEFCGYYFNMHFNSPITSVPTKDFVEEDSVVYLRNKDKNMECVYCIYESHLLPTSPYEWEGSIHLYRDEAIKLGLISKKKSDIVVIDEIEYEVTDILSLDCYFFRLCMNKMIEKGSVKAFSIKTDGYEMTNYEEFKKWIVDNTKNSGESENIINNYNDLSSFPTPIYILQSFTRFNYSELILAFIENQQVIFREILSSKKERTDEYVLSYSALIVLYKLGIDASVLIDNNVYIPHSTVEMITSDMDDIIKINQKEHAATMGVINNELIVQEASSDEKQWKMKEAVNIKEYANKLTSIDNKVDLEIKWNDDFKIKDVLGVCDCDAISIASSKNYTLVTAEAILTAVTQNEEYVINTIGITDFLCEINIPALELLKIMKKMVNYRFMVTLTERSFLYILTQYSNSEQEIKDQIIELWKLYLNEAESYENSYKEIFKQCISTVYAKIYNNDIDKNSMIFQEFAISCMKYNNLRIEIDFNEDGELVLTTYKIMT